MNYYALTLLLYYAFYFGFLITKAGQKDYEITTTFWWACLSTVGSYTLLILGGFFTQFHWPQITILCLSALAIGTFAANGFKPHKSKPRPFTFLFISIIIWLIYREGGFKLYE